MDTRDMSGRPGISAGRRTFSWNATMRPSAVRLDHPELLGLGARDTGMAATVRSAPNAMCREHLAHVHLVDVVAAEDDDVVRGLVRDHVQVW
jgi:hypothetical protein